MLFSDNISAPSLFKAIRRQRYLSISPGAPGQRSAVAEIPRGDILILPDSQRLHYAAVLDDHIVD